MWQDGSSKSALSTFFFFFFLRCLALQHSNIGLRSLLWRARVCGKVAPSVELVISRLWDGSFEADMVPIIKLHKRLRLQGPLSEIYSLALPWPLRIDATGEAPRKPARRALGNVGSNHDPSRLYYTKGWASENAFPFFPLLGRCNPPAVILTFVYADGFLASCPRWWQWHWCCPWP